MIVPRLLRCRCRCCHLAAAVVVSVAAAIVVLAEVVVAVVVAEVELGLGLESGLLEHATEVAGSRLHLKTPRRQCFYTIWPMHTHPQFAGNFLSVP